MIAITIGGEFGAGGREIGQHIAHLTGSRYVHILALRRIARQLGATATAVAQKELQFGSRLARFWAFMELAFERMGYHGNGVAWLPHGFDPRLLQDTRKTLPAEISDREYVGAVYDTAAEFHAEGDIVLVKRAGCVTLKGAPDTVHIGLFASRPARIARVARRLHVGHLDAEEVVRHFEAARRAWFHKLGAPEPEDPSHYDITVHTDLDNSEGATARRALEAVRELVPGAARGLSPSAAVA